MTSLEVLRRLDEHEFERRAHYCFHEMSPPGRRVGPPDDDVCVEVGLSLLRIGDVADQ